MSELGSVILANLSTTTNGDLIECEPLSKNITELIIDGPLTLLSIILGIIGNVRACTFLSSCKLNKRVVANMTILFAFDSLLLISALFYYCLTSIFELFQIQIPMDRLIVLFHAPAAITLTATIWLTVLITVDRFIAVRRPFMTINGCHWTNLNGQETFWDNLKFYKMPLLVVVVAVIINIPIFFEMRYHDCKDTILGGLSKNALPTMLRLDPLYINLYRLAFKLTIETVGPFVLAVVLLTFTQVSIYRSNANRMRLAPGSSKDNSEYTVYMMAIIIVVKFLVLHFLRVVLEFWEALYGLSSFFDTIAKVSNLLVAINSATNYLVYLGKKPALKDKKVKRTQPICNVTLSASNESHVLMVLHKKAADGEAGDV
uniref:G_PROTEIN_RECEP_F1_2 domain-containing protein n=1 Tax=Rhabditophanes sp. KR3021 TaxID=114890 RepID=A0AC35UED1_9BILA